MSSTTEPIKPLAAHCDREDIPIPLITITPPTPTSTGEDAEDEDPLFARVRAGVDHTRSRLATGDIPTLCTQVVLDVDSPSMALTTLRNASREGIATLIWTAPTSECYSFGVEPTFGARNHVGLNPQWWVGLSAAEIKAGPQREGKDVARAEGVLKKKRKREVELEKRPSKRMKEEKEKLEEGLRRQQGRRRMCD